MRKWHKTFFVFISVILLALIVGVLFFGNKVMQDKTNNKIKKAAAVNNTKTEKSKETSAAKSDQSSQQSNVKMISNDQGIPVLMYHSIAIEKGNELRVPPEKFAEQMKYLHDNGYNTLSLDELNDFLMSNKQVPEKSIVITFDDGYQDNYTNAFPILKQYGFKATIFEITSDIDKNSAYVTSAEIKEMQQSGVNVESHTVSHDPLAKESADRQKTELAESKKTLEQVEGRTINYIAYPDGSYNQNTIKLLEQTGYKMAFISDGRWALKKDAPYTLHRVYIYASADINIFKDRISNPNYVIK